MEKQLSFKGTLKGSFIDFKKMLPGILLFEIIYRVLTNLIFKPLLAFILKLMLFINGTPAVFNNSIFDFILTVPGILAILLILVVAAIFIYYEFSVITLYSYFQCNGQAKPIWYCVRMAFTTFGSIKNWGILGFSAYSLLLLPFVGIGFSSSILSNLDLPNFITGELLKTGYGPVLLFVIMAAVIVLFFINIFMIPTMVLERKTFGQASKRAPSLLKKAGRGVLVVVVVFLVVWAAIDRIPSLLFDMTLGDPYPGFAEIDYIYGASFPSFLLGLLLIARSVAQFFLMPVLMVVIVHFYLAIDPQVELDETSIQKVDKNIERATPYLQRAWQSIRNFFTWLSQKIKASPHRKHIRNAIVTVSIIIILAVIISLSIPSPGLHPPLTISHRGSIYGVENTLPALEQAIEKGADYAEVDVQLSRDGIPVAIHDTNLSRLAGQDVNVYDLTAEELGQIELNQNGYTGTIPTLEEVAQAAKGRIKLGVELKPHGHETGDLVAESIQVLEQNHFDDFMLLSIDYSFVSQLKEEYPQYKVGYCVFGAIGDISAAQINKLGIDFIVVEEWMVSEELVNEFDKAWIPVYVWTVNDELSMRKYLDAGILGIVTDFPDVAHATIERFKAETGRYYFDEMDDYTE